VSVSHSFIHRFSGSNRKWLTARISSAIRATVALPVPTSRPSVECASARPARPAQPPRAPPTAFGPPERLAAPGALRPRPGDARGDSLLDDRALELREHAEHLEERLAGRRVSTPWRSRYRSTPAPCSSPRKPTRSCRLRPSRSTLQAATMSNWRRVIARCKRSSAVTPGGQAADRCCVGSRRAWFCVPEPQQRSGVGISSPNRRCSSHPARSSPERCVNHLLAYGASSRRPSGRIRWSSSGTSPHCMPNDHNRAASALFTSGA